MRVNTSVSLSEIKNSPDISAAIVRTAERIAEEARLMCPEDEKELQNSIGVSEEKDGAVIFADTDYAADVEFGTSKREASPFLVPAFLDAEKILCEEIGDLTGGKYERH